MHAYNDQKTTQNSRLQWPERNTKCLPVMTGKQSKTHAGDDRNIAQNAYLYLPENNAKCTSVITWKQHKIHACNDKNNIKILSDAQFKIRMVRIFLQGPFSEGKIFTNNAYFIVASAGRSAWTSMTSEIISIYLLMYAIYLYNCLTMSLTTKVTLGRI
jgi:hypothetical protein